MRKTSIVGERPLTVDEMDRNQKFRQAHRKLGLYYLVRCSMSWMVLEDTGDDLSVLIERIRTTALWNGEYFLIFKSRPLSVVTWEDLPPLPRPYGNASAFAVR